MSRSWREGHHERDDERFGPSRPARKRPAQTRDRGRRPPSIRGRAARSRHHSGVASPLRWNTTPRSAVLAVARRRNESTYPELVGPHARAVVLAGEIGGRWSAETRTFVGLLAKAKAREVPVVLRKRAEWAWWRRWGSLLACASARAFRVLARLANLWRSGRGCARVPRGGARCAPP